MRALALTALACLATTVIAVPTASAQVEGTPCDTAALAADITAANQSSEAVTLSLASACEYRLAEPLPVITGALTIVGNGATITRNADAEPFRIIAIDERKDLAKSVTLCDLTISGGQTDGNGGGIFASPGNVTLNRVAITGNRAGGAGGGVFVFTSHLVISDSEIHDNAAGVDKSGHGGGITGSFWHASVTGTTIYGNTTTGTGGAIDAGGYLFGLTIDQSAVTDNTAGVDGGGLFMGNEGWSGVKITDASMVGNNPDNCAGTDSGNQPTACRG